MSNGKGKAQDKPLLDPTTSDGSPLRQLAQNASTYISLLPLDVLWLVQKCISVVGPSVDQARLQGSIHGGMLPFRVMCHGGHIIAKRAKGRLCNVIVLDIHTGVIVWSSPDAHPSLLICVNSRGVIFTLLPAAGTGSVWRPPQKTPIHDFSYPVKEHAAMLAIGERVLIVDGMRIFEVSLTQKACLAVASCPYPLGIKACVSAEDWLCNYTARTLSHGDLAIWVYAKCMIVYFVDWKDRKISSPLQCVKVTSPGSPVVYQSRLLAPDGAVYDLNDLRNPVREEKWFGDLQCLPSGEPYLVVPINVTGWRLFVLDRDGVPGRSHDCTFGFMLLGDEAEAVIRWCVAGDTLIICAKQHRVRYVLASKLWAKNPIACAEMLPRLPDSYEVPTVPSVHAGHLILQDHVSIGRYPLCYDAPVE